MEGRMTTPPTTPGVHKRARQIKAQRQCETRHSVPNSSQMCRQHRLQHKYCSQTNTRQCAMEEAQGNQDANRQERMSRADFIPALSWDCPLMPGKIMHGRPEGGGSFGNGLLDSKHLPRRRMNQRLQAFPTLLHCPDSS
jgi:hypothetical protein